MRSMKNKVKMAAAVLSVAMIVSACSAPQLIEETTGALQAGESAAPQAALDQNYSFTVGTSSSGGSVYAIGAGLSNLLSSKIEGLDLRVGFPQLLPQLFRIRRHILCFLEVSEDLRVFQLRRVGKGRILFRGSLAGRRSCFSPRPSVSGPGSGRRRVWPRLPGLRRPGVMLRQSRPGPGSSSGRAACRTGNRNG